MKITPSTRCRGWRTAFWHSYTATTSGRQVALWRQARGGMEVRNIKTFLDNVYAQPGDKGSLFMAQDLPPELPLSTYLWQADSALKKQQHVSGVVAQALSRGLDMMEEPLNQINHMCEMIEDAEVRQQIRSSVERIQEIQEEALTPVGHSFIYLAANFNDIAFKRREAAAMACGQR